jgi:hypothetical protein
MADAGAAQRISDLVLRRMDNDPEWREAFARALGDLIYELIHTDCLPGCACTPGRSGVRTGKAATV